MSVTDTLAPYTGGGYSELATEVRALGLLRPRPLFYAAVLVTDLAVLAAVVAGMFVLQDRWAALLLAPVFAVVSTQFGFYGHDAGHRQISKRRTPSLLLGLLTGNLLNGLSYAWWVGKHNAHHAHPNDLERDPDVHAGALVFSADQTAGRRGVSAWVTRHQAWLFFPLLTLEALNLRVSSVLALRDPRMRHRATEGALLCVHAAGYVALLVTTLTWQQAIAFAAVHQALFGIYLGCSFAPGHKGMPTLTPDQAADPLLRQVLTSRNIRGSLVLDYALGGLNYQIEHHLFPSMSRPDLRRAQPVVRRFCEDRGIPYLETTPRASYAMGLRHLHRVGAERRRERRDLRSRRPAAVRRPSHRDRG